MISRLITASTEVPMPQVLSHSTEPYSKHYNIREDVKYFTSKLISFNVQITAFSASS